MKELSSTRRQPRAGLVNLVAALWVAAAQPVAAEVPVAAEPGESLAKNQARELLSAGNSKLDEGRYLEAVELFERAFAAYPSPRLHFNIAQTWRELGRPLEALERYELFVREVSREEGGAQWNLANERIFELQGAIATLHLQVNQPDAAAVIDGRPALFQRAERVIPGPHVIVVSKPGYRREVIEIALKAGETQAVRVKLLTEDEAAAELVIVQRAEQLRREAQALLDEERGRRELSQSRVRIAGWSMSAAGVVAALGAGGAWFFSLGQAAKVEGAREGTAWSDVKGNYDASILSARVALYSALASAVLGLSGGTLLFFGHRNPKPEQVGALQLTPSVVPGGFGLALGGGF